jgi:hypothetical protein
VETGLTNQECRGPLASNFIPALESIHHCGGYLPTFAPCCHMSAASLLEQLLAMLAFEVHRRWKEISSKALSLSHLLLLLNNKLG